MRQESKSRWTSEYARPVLAHADQSGLTDQAFARQRGINSQRLWWWRKRLTQPFTPAQPPAATFVEIHLLTAAAARQPSTVQTRSGRTILVPAGFDAAELRRLLAAIEEEGC